MKVDKGVVQSVEQDEGKNGPYLRVQLNDNYFSVFDEDIFEHFKPGNEIKIQYEVNESDGRKFKNIQDAKDPSENGNSNSNGSSGGPDDLDEVMGNGGQESQSKSSSGSSSSKTEVKLKVRALELAVECFGEDDESGEKGKVLSVAKKFYSWLKG